jgi:hypothetical protein
VDFDDQTRKSSTILILRLNKETITTDFEVKLKKTVTTSFEAKPEKTVSVILRSNH